MMFHSVNAGDNCINLAILIRDNQLEGAEKLLSTFIKILYKLVQRHFNSCGLVCAIA